MGEPLRILSIGAHPADVFDQSGGTMAHHTARGDWVGCIILTHGARIHDKVVADEMFHRDRIPQGDELTSLMKQRAEVKGKEVKEACAMLGVEDLYFLDVDDSVLLVSDPLIRQIAILIRELKPDVVLTHFPKEDGGVASPHATTGVMVMHALELAASVDPDDDTPPHKVAHVYYYGAGAAAVRKNVWHTEGGYYNDVFIDITDVIQTKLAAMDKLVSQGYAGAYVRKRMETNDGAFGNAAGVGYAEGFISQRASTHYHLPVSPINLQLARLSDHQALARRSYRENFDHNNGPANQQDAHAGP